MSKEWLAAANYERTQGLVSAINTLSMHAKLALLGRDDAKISSHAQTAREFLRRFLERFAVLVSDAESAPFSPLPGADPRLRSLANRYLHAREQTPARSILFELPPAELDQLLVSDDADDRERLVDCLRTLRAVLEEQAHTDLTDLLGKL